MRLLIIEDDPHNRHMGIAALSACGHTVEGVADGSAALENLSRSPFDGILMVEDAGGLGAFELVKQVKRSPHHHTALFVLLGVPRDIASVSAAVNAGITGYLTRPFNLETLGDEIENLATIARIGGGEDGDSADADSLDDDPTLNERIQPEDLMGKVIDDKYELIKMLGRGGMGEVYQARHIYLDRPLAIKLLPQSKIKGSSPFSSFIKEARILARIRSPQIVEIHDFGFTSWKSPYLCMELVEGLDLRKLLRLRAHLSISAVEQIAIQICNGLATAHETGILHLDLKPSNVMLCGSATGNRGVIPDVKILDFGIARFLEEAERDGGVRNITVRGTMAYMPPERCRGEALGPGSDMYALGVMIFEMLTGRTPFIARDRETLLYHQLSAPAPSPRTFRSDTPPYLEKLVLKLLDKELDDRFASARELSGRLERHVGDSYDDPMFSSEDASERDSLSQDTELIQPAFEDD